MPEGMRARGKGGLVQPWLAMARQDTLDLGAIDSAARDSASHPCAQDLDLIPKVCPLSNLMPQARVHVISKLLYNSII
jgi:hypothetical protein